MIASHSGGHIQSGETEIVRQEYDPSREVAMNRYSVPSYRNHDKPTGISLHLPLQRPRRGGRPWVIHRAINFHANVGAFLDFVEDLSAGQSLPSKTLYIDRYAWVSLWLVQVHPDYILEYPIDKLEKILSRRAEQLSCPPNEILVYGLGTEERIRQKLIKMDKDGVVAREMPEMRALSGPAGWVLFASMVLPKLMEEGEIFTYWDEVTVPLPLHALDFIVDSKKFQRLSGVSWNCYLSEFGDEPATLKMLPISIRRRAHFQTLKYLIGHALPEDPNSVHYPGGSFYILNRSRLDWLPPPARTPAHKLTNELTLALNEFSGKDGGSRVGSALSSTALAVEPRNSLASRLSGSKQRALGRVNLERHRSNLSGGSRRNGQQLVLTRG